MAYTQISLVISKLLWHFGFEAPKGQQLGQLGSRPVPPGSSEGREEYDMYDIFVPKHD